MAKLRFKFGISFSIQYIPTSITLVFHANIIAGQGSVNTDSGGCKGQESQGTCNGDPSVSSEKTRVPALPLSLSDCMTLGSLASQRSQDNEGA